MYSCLKNVLLFSCQKYSCTPVKSTLVLLSKVLMYSCQKYSCTPVKKVLLYLNDLPVINLFLL